ncbi:MAG TPA: penicillin-insensitive murein endopeptidase [Candidatus Competibacteraceae bacterium]|nr:penicillin-insensitive murein endopeptidase [Candidatus Competibacteraceae bacterium]
MLRPSLARSAIALGLGLVLLATAAPLHANGWSRVRDPLPGRPQVIGSYTAGCLAGATTLPLEGQGYQVMRRSRNRNHGHPQLIALIQRLGAAAAARGATLLVGDLAQPRGGPMPSGHRSHQLGLDGDIWLLAGPPQGLSLQDTEELPAPSMVDAVAVKVTARWTRYQRDMLKLAASQPEVERIFINPVIKLHLCRSESERDWLRKLRPWWGHDAHFHVRLACPPGSPRCEAQQPVPAGDGCDADLLNWVKEQRQAALHPQPPRPPQPSRPVLLPTACNAVLAGGGPGLPERELRLAGDEP